MEKPTSQPIDITKMFEQFKLPGVDISALMEARRKDIEALTEVNKIALQSSQTMAQKQVEILQKTMEELKQAMSAGKPMENAAKQGEVVQHAMQKAFTYMRELAELLGREIGAGPGRDSAAPPRVVAVIDESRCIGCALCLPACPVDAIVGASRFMHTVIASQCTGCELCLPPCPVDCIELRPADERVNPHRPRHAA